MKKDKLVRLINDVLTEGDFSFGNMPERSYTTMERLINTATREGYIKYHEGSAQYIMDAAKKVGAMWDKLHPEEQKVYRDTYYDKFLKMIHKK